jgi:acyl carrier protein
MEDSNVSETSIEQRVRNVVLSILDVKDDDLQPSVRFRDLGAGSIDFVEILSALENEFNVDIPDEAAPGLNTVQKIVVYMEARQDAVHR